VELRQPRNIIPGRNHSNNVERYYYCLDGQKIQGPLDASVLETYLSRKVIPSTTLVWKEGDTEWIPANRLSDISAIPQQNSAPVSRPSSSLKSAQCPSCGGPLELSNHGGHVKCLYCGSDIILENAEIHPEAPRIEPKAAENLPSPNASILHVARVALEGKQYAEAYRLYSSILERDAASIDAWLGKAMAAPFKNAGFGIVSRYGEIYPLDEALAIFRHLRTLSLNEDTKKIIVQYIISLLHAGYLNDCYEVFKLAWEWDPSVDTASHLMEAMGPNALGIKTQNRQPLDGVGQDFGKVFVSTFIYSDPILKNAFKEARKKWTGQWFGGAIYGLFHH
jgi:hypothetical protein